MADVKWIIGCLNCDLQTDKYPNYREARKAWDKIVESYKDGKES